MRRCFWAVPLLLGCLVGCSQEGEYSLSVCVAVDVSGTYTDQLSEVTTILRSGVLPHLLPGDSLVVVRIDSESYEQDNVVARMSLDHRPSNANAQKLAFARQLDAFAEHAEASEFTDITGAVMLCADYLHESAAGSKVIFVFSDLEVDLPEGVSQTLPQDELAGIAVAAMNVKQLRQDSSNPEVYRQRLADWQEQVLAAGARQWRVVVNPGKLPEYLETIRR